MQLKRKGFFSFKSLIKGLSFMYLLSMSLSLGEAKTLKVGVTAGPHAMILEKVKEEAKKLKLEVESIEFNDFILPNAALDQGDLDLNSMQHLPYLQDQNKTKGYKLVSVGKTVLMPIGVYSKKISKLADLKEGAKIGIPNDPSNGSRALKLLASAGLLKLKDTEIASIMDIQENPKKLDIVELEAPQIPRSLDDLDCGVTNTDWILLAKIDPQSALLREGTDSPYTNIIAVNESRKDDPDIKKFVEIYHSKPIRDYIIKEFKGAIIPAF